MMHRENCSCAGAEKGERRVDMKDNGYADVIVLAH